MVCGDENRTEYAGRGKYNTDYELPQNPRSHIRKHVQVVRANHLRQNKTLEHGHLVASRQQ